MFRKQESGSMTLEAALVLPICIFIFLSIFGLFGMVSARQQINRAVVQASKSLSLDPYLQEKMGTAAGQLPSLANYLTGFMRSGSDQNFSNQTKWYTSGNKDVAKKRFYGFFANGDSAAADKKLKDLGVSNFDLECTVSGTDLTLTAKYDVKYLFDIFKTSPFRFKFEVKSRLWKK